MEAIPKPRLALDVEGVADLRILADQFAHPARNLLLRRLGRVPELDRAEALGRLVRDPRSEAEPRHLVALVAEVVPQLGDGRFRFGEAPEDEADDHGRRRM